jgi:predicted TIM-barrel fold metal-dependent hydrolase
MIIDAHSHLYPPPENKKFLVSKSEYLNVNEWVNFKDECGISRSVTFGMGSPGDNEYILEASKEYPKKIIPWMWINPKNNTVEDLEIGIQRGFKGIKLHPRIDAYKINNLNLMRPFMEVLERHGIPVLIHSDPANTYSNPFHIAELAKAYPSLIIIIGHMGIVYNVIDAIYVAIKQPNIILDTSTHVGLRRVKQAVEAIGAERIVFGSDFPASHPLVEMKKIKVCKLHKGEEELIMGGNMARILKID